jgi:D-3-phosphoglycerate dehydrogenase
MFQVVITDATFPDFQMERSILEPHGIQLNSLQGADLATQSSMLSQADAVIVQFAKITDAMMAAMPKARVLVRYGIGVDNVDLVAAARRAIPVCNVPDYCIDEVADHTLAFLLALTRQVVPNHLHIQHGHWGLAVPLNSMRSLREMTVGIVGFGRIGRAVASRLAPFGCHLLIHDPFASGQEPPANATWADLPHLLKASDAVTLHCPSNDQTRRLLNSSTIATMKRGALVINPARGDLIETGALIEALKLGHLGGAALDVCDPEPIPGDSPLRTMPQILLASHIASASPTAVARLRTRAAQHALTAIQGGLLSDCVNGITRFRNPIA